MALKLALLLGELAPTERSGLLCSHDYAALLVTQGYAGHVTHLLDTASAAERAQLLAAHGLVAALREVEGLSAVAARFEALSPVEHTWLLSQHDSLTGWVEQGLAPTLSRLFATLPPEAVASVLDIEHQFLLSELHPLLVAWHERLTQPVAQRMKLVPSTPN